MPKRAPTSFGPVADAHLRDAQKVRSHCVANQAVVRDAPLVPLAGNAAANHDSTEQTRRVPLNFESIFRLDVCHDFTKGKVSYRGTQGRLRRYSPRLGGGYAPGVAPAQPPAQILSPEGVLRDLAMLEPSEGIVFDPCCGSAGMFVQSDIFTKHNRRLSFVGQDSKGFTYRLCRMNLFIHGLDGNIQLGNSYFDDKHATDKSMTSSRTHRSTTAQNGRPVRPPRRSWPGPDPAQPLVGSPESSGPASRGPMNLILPTDGRGLFIGVPARPVGGGSGLPRPSRRFRTIAANAHVVAAKTPYPESAGAPHLCSNPQRHFRPEVGPCPANPSAMGTTPRSF